MAALEATDNAVILFRGILQTRHLLQEYTEKSKVATTAVEREKKKNGFLVALKTCQRKKGKQTEL